MPLSSSPNSKSLTATVWCSCRHLRPKCWVRSHHIVLNSGCGEELPSFPCAVSPCKVSGLTAFVIISRTNVASVGSAFNGTRKVKVLPLPETIKEKSTFRAKALRRELVVGVGENHTCFYTS